MTDIKLVIRFVCRRAYFIYDLALFRQDQMIFIAGHHQSTGCNIAQADGYSPDFKLAPDQFIFMV